MNLSLLFAPFSKVVSNIEDDASEEPRSGNRPVVKIALGAFMAVVLILSVGLGLFVRLWQRLETFFEVIQ